MKIPTSGFICYYHVMGYDLNRASWETVPWWKDGLEVEEFQTLSGQGRNQREVCKALSVGTKLKGWG